MNQQKHLPLIPLNTNNKISKVSIIRNSLIHDNEFLKFQINNSLNFKKELKQKLNRNLPSKKIKPILSKLIKAVINLEEFKVVSGLIKNTKNKNCNTLYYYRIKIKGMVQSKIEILLVKLSHIVNLEKLFKKKYEQVRKQYKKSIRLVTSKKERKYLKGLGKGKIDYDNEKTLGLSKVELITLKDQLKVKLGLRNVNELYWVALRCGYVK